MANKYLNDGFKGSGRLEERVALITGGDSGIGRAIAVAFAREGADVVIVYLEEEEDAQESARLVEKQGQRCRLHCGDIGQRSVCTKAVQAAVEAFGQLDILVNNAAEQHIRSCITEITDDQLERTFCTNLFSMFCLTAAALPHLQISSHPAIINTTSVAAYRGSPKLLDYSATKGVIVSFTRSLQASLPKREFV